MVDQSITVVSSKTEGVYVGVGGGVFGWLRGVTTRVLAIISDMLHIYPPLPSSLWLYPTFCVHNYSKRTDPFRWFCSYLICYCLKSSNCVTVVEVYSRLLLETS